jgi:hypothetical protein
MFTYMDLEAAYRKGYAAGYDAGLTDSVNGREIDWQNVAATSRSHTWEDISDGE